MHIMMAPHQQKSTASSSSIRKKRRRQRRRRRCSSKQQQQQQQHEIVERFNLLSLPSDLMSEIIDHIAATSAIQLVRTIACCKELEKVGEENHVYRLVSIDELSELEWFHPNTIASFFNKCLSFKNPHAIYRQGLTKFFRHLDKQSAMDCLKEAADYGHMGAYYAMSIINLFSNNDEEKQNGASQLLRLKKHRCSTSNSSNESKIKEYRTSLEMILRDMWIAKSLRNNRDQIERRRCEKLQCNSWQYREWNGEGFEKMCDACLIDEEVEYVLRFVRPLP